MVANLPETLSPAEGAGRKRAQRAKGQISRGSGKTYLARLTKILRHLGYEPDKDGAKPVTPLLDTKKVREAVDALSEPSERGGKKDRAITKKTNAKDLFSSINSIDNQMDAGKRIPQDVREAYVEDMATSQEGLEANAEFMAIDNGEKLGHPFLAALDKDEKTAKKYTSVRDVEHLMEIHKECIDHPHIDMHCLYEMVKEDHPSWMHFDLDDIYPKGEDIPDVLHHFIRIFEAFCFDVLEKNPDGFKYLISGSPREKGDGMKVSFHIVVKYLKTTDLAARHYIINEFGYYVRSHFLDPDSTFHKDAALLINREKGWPYIQKKWETFADIPRTARPDGPLRQRPPPVPQNQKGSHPSSPKKRGRTLGVRRTQSEDS
eukprot:jgi/Mesvir1/26212/Mv02395-RA.1